MSAIEDGTHDGVVIDVDERDDDTIALDIALSRGAHKGEVVRVRTTRTERDALTWLGLPVVVIVDGATVRVRVD
jgi:hypothetical protein